MPGWEGFKPHVQKLIRTYTFILEKTERRAKQALRSEISVFTLAFTE
jgi:hypothetical protein